MRHVPPVADRHTQALFEQWRTRDVGAWKDRLFGELASEAEAQVWEFIEANYLNRYRRFLRVDVHPGGAGLWEIHFPGSTELRRPVAGEAQGLPAHLIARLRGWQQLYEEEAAGCGCAGFDWERFDAVGRGLAFEVKRVVGTACYVEHRRWCEILLVDGEPVELDVPAPLLRIIEGGRRLPPPRPALPEGR